MILKQIAIKKKKKKKKKQLIVYKIMSETSQYAIFIKKNKHKSFFSFVALCCSELEDLKTQICELKESLKSQVFYLHFW